MKNDKFFISISILILIVLIFTSCSDIFKRREVVFPDNADWNFKYYDCFGIELWSGKASMKYNQDDSSFKLKLMEGVFGEEATITGTVSSLDEITNTYPFTGEGKWFDSEEDYRFVGRFNSDFTEIYDGAVVYSTGIETEIEELLLKMEEYRLEVIEYNMLTPDEKDKINYPEKPTPDYYLSNFFTWESTNNEEKAEVK